MNNWKKNDDFVRINERIKISPLRVINAEGENLGVMDTASALKLARDAALDLVEISPDTRPVVCRIMDFGKFKYEQAVKQKEQKKHTRQNQIKEVWLRPVTQEHDLETKTKQLQRFIEEGHCVLVKIEFKAREITHKDLGFDILDELISKVAAIGVARKPSFNGKILICQIDPIRS